MIKKKSEDDGLTRRVNAVVPMSWVTRVDEWRRHQPDIPSVSESIRRLVEIGIDCSQDNKKRR